MVSNQIKEIARVKSTRIFLLEMIKDLSVDELNEIPAGFNNNIIWNLGHLIAAQQGICYVRAGLSPAVIEQHYAPFRPGTKPGKYLDGNEVVHIKQTLLKSLDQFETDLQNNAFANYIPWTTRYGVELASIDDALQFLLFHEGLHSGCITAIKKVLKYQALTASDSL